MKMVNLRDVAPPSAADRTLRSGERVWQLNLDQVEAQTGRILSKVFSDASSVGSSTQPFDNGNVLYSKLRPYLNKVVLPDESGIATTELVPLRPDPKKLERRYLAYYLRSPSFVAWASNEVAGAKMPRVVMQSFWKQQIPLPPLAEQKRIAAILDKADAIRRKLQQSLRLSDDFLRSVFLDMFGDPVTNPKGWPVHKSGDLFADKPRLGTTRPATGTGYLVVRVGEIGSENVIFSKCGRVEQTDEELRRFRLAKGDILIARAIGSRDQLGKCSFFTGHKEIVVGDSHVMRLRPDTKKCDPYWLYFLLSSPSGKALLQSKGGATAVQFNINGTQASDLDIPLPPMKLQSRFVDVANSTRKEIEHTSELFADAESLFSSLQQRAFRGEL